VTRPGTILYLFDLDGTLLRAGGAGSRALDHVFRTRYGIEGAMTGIDPGGRTDPWILGEVFSVRFGRRPAEDEITAILDDYVPVLEREMAIAEKFRVLPYVVEVLDWFAARPEVVVGVATGNVAAAARAKIARAGLEGRFVCGGYGCDSAQRPEVVARAIARAVEIAGGVDRVVVVGDTVHDVTAARACGADVVAVTTGTDRREVLEAAGPDAVMDSLGDLPAWHQARFAA
jgi:phosphoglycolate phosphatase